VAKYRDLCPPGTEDTQITLLLERSKNDAQKIETAISELWEDHRGGGQDDWATVAKKGKKKVRLGSFACFPSSPFPRAHILLTCS
jgi:hypothetical protein